MRILIADDDATSRVVLEAIATKLGHECLVATDGSRAWELLSSEGVDVLLTDWLMPGVDGPELCRRVRSELGASEHGATAGEPVVVGCRALRLFKLGRCHERGAPFSG